MSIVETLKVLKDCPWYWGPIPRAEAESLLCSKEDGSFLLRDSENSRYILTLSFKNGSSVQHTRVEYGRGQFHFHSQPATLNTSNLVELIRDIVRHSTDGSMRVFLKSTASSDSMMPLVLRYPVTKRNGVSSLQNICRGIILDSVHREHIDQLPLPASLKAFVHGRNDDIDWD